MVKALPFSKSGCMKISSVEGRCAGYDETKEVAYTARLAYTGVPVST